MSQNSDFRALILAHLDTKNIPNEIKQIENTQINLSNIKFDKSKLINSIQSALNSYQFNIKFNSPNFNTQGFTSQAQQTGTNAGRQFVNSFNRAINNIDLHNGGISHLSNMLQGAGFDKKSISSITEGLGNMKLTIDKVKTSMLSNGNIRLTINGTDEMQRAVQIIRDYDRETGNVINRQRTFTQNIGQQVQQTKRNEEAISSYIAKLDKLQSKYNDPNATNPIRNEQSLQLLNNEYNRIIGVIQNLKNADSETFGSMKANIDKEIDGLSSLIDKIKNAEKSQIRNERDIAQANLVLTNSSKLSNDIQTWMNNNTKAAERYGIELRNLREQLKGNTDATDLKRINARFREIQSGAKAAGLVTSSFAKSLKNTILQITGLGSAVMVFNKIVRVIKAAYENVVKVDTAMVSLRRVTTLSEQQYTELYSKMTASAKSYGVALADIIQSTADWVKLGFDSDTSEKLAEITTMYQHVTDLDNDTAVKNLVTAYKGYQSQLEEVYDNDAAKSIEYIADIYDKLGNEFAESAADVGEGLTHASSVLSQSGNSIQEAAGMFTGIQEVIQDSSTAGTTLKILALRLRGMKGELLSLDEEVDENVISISKMQTQILNLTHGHVNIFNDDGTFKSTYEIMKGISEVYDELSDSDRADLLETIAGKNRANGVQALLSNWSQVEKAVNAANNAEGTAAAENEKYMAGIQGHLDSLNASVQSLSNSALNSNAVKFAIDFLNNATNSADVLVNTVGTLPVLLTTIAGGLSAIKNIGRNKMFFLNVNMPIVIIVLFRYKQFRYYGC